MKKEKLKAFEAVKKKKLQFYKKQFLCNLH